MDLLPLTVPDASPLVVQAAPVVGKPGLFRFATPNVEPGELFRVEPRVSDPDCEPMVGDKSTTYWLSGKDLSINVLLGGKTQLQILDHYPYNDNPCDDINKSFEGETINCWSDDEVTYGVLSKLIQRFRWQTELPGATKAMLQVSFAPFTDTEADLLAPPSMLAKWDLSCVNCNFDAPLKDIAPKQPATKKSIFTKGFNVAKWPFEQVGKGAKSAVSGIGHLLGIGGGKDKNAPLRLGKPQIPGQGGGQYLSQGNFITPFPFVYYFRLVPLTKDGELAGGPSNAVALRWLGEKQPGPDLKILNCPPGQVAISATKCGPPPSKPKPFTVEVVQYNPLVPPLKSEACFIATGDGTGIVLSNHYHAVDHGDHSLGVMHKYFKDDILCPPDPPESCGLDSLDAVGACIEAGFNALEEAFSWVSEAYNDAKAFAVNTALSALGPLVPDALCNDTCLKAALDTGISVALASAGLPPGGIPNLDQLMDQGLDYLAEQAVAQLPPEAVTAAEAAGYDPKDIVKDALNKGIHEMQASYADSVDWLPSGVPVTPDGWQTPKVAVKITRDGSVPYDCKTTGLNLGVTSYMRNEFTDPALKAPVQSFNAGLPSFYPKLQANTDYQFYLTSTRPLPCLAPGESVTVPVLLYPAKTFGTGYGLLIYADNAWFYTLYKGSANFNAYVYEKNISNPIGQGNLKTAADESYP